MEEFGGNMSGSASGFCELLLILSTASNSWFVLKLFEKKTFNKAFLFVLFLTGKQSQTMLETLKPGKRTPPHFQYPTSPTTSTRPFSKSSQVHSLRAMMPTTTTKGTRTFKSFGRGRSTPGSDSTCSWVTRWPWSPSTR